MAEDFNVTQPPPELVGEGALPMAPSAIAQLQEPVAAAEQPQVLNQPPAPEAPAQPTAVPPPRPPGTSSLGQYQGTKGQIFRNMLGDFMYSASKGLEAAGHGPEANARGAGAGGSAIYERNIQQQQLALQAQQIQAMQAYHQAQAAALQQRSQPATWIDEQGVPHQMSAQDFAALKGRELAANARETAATTQGTTATAVQGMKNVAGAAQNTSKENIAAGQIASKEKLAGANLDEKIAEFKQTQNYKVWKAKLDNDTKIRVADLTQSKAPGSMIATASYATGGLQMLSDAQTAMARLEARGVFGGVARNKIEDWIFGKGLVDPSLPPQDREDIGKMRAAFGYTSSASMRVHTGRTSQEIYNDFKQRLGAGQDLAALKGAAEETGTLLEHYANAASNENVRSIRSGNAVTPKAPGNAPKAGVYDFVNGQLVPRKK